jgi:transcriptional regulator with XRE-family HTH domain
MEEWKQRLRDARMGKGMSKTAFAAAVGVSNATATDWEKSIDAGGIKEISGPKLTRACEVLGVDPHWLLHGKLAKTSPLNAGDAPGIPWDDPSPSVTERLQAESSDDAMRHIAEIIETYRLASPSDRERIDLAVSEARRRIIAGNKTKAGPA